VSTIATAKAPAPSLHISAATVTASPAPGPASGTGDSSGIVTGLLSGAVIAAVIAAGISLWLARRRSLEEERSHVRTNLAEAFQAYSKYKEFPYAIRRRRHDEPAAERVRLSEAMSGVQARLSYSLAWTAAEAPIVGQKYAALVDELRRVAGRAMHEAWLAPPITIDAGMNIPSAVVDLSSLKPHEDAYLEAVKSYQRRLTACARIRRGR